MATQARGLRPQPREPWKALEQQRDVVQAVR